MKKIFFALFCFFLPNVVLASSAYLKTFEPFNGYLLTPFESKNNVYTIRLDETATKLDFQYELEDTESIIEVIGGEYIENQKNKLIIKIQNDKSKDSQEYVFYLEKEDNQSVIHSDVDKMSLELNQKENVIPHLKLIVISICSIFILILFKILVLNFFQEGRKGNHQHKH